METATPGQTLDTSDKIEKEETGPDHSLDIADIAAQAIMTYTETTPDCNKGMDTATIEAVQGDPTQHTEATVAEPTVTHHTVKVQYVMYHCSVVIVMLCSCIWVLCSLFADNSDSPYIVEQSQ